MLREVPYLSSKSQEDEHEEEEQRPQRRNGEQREGFWVSHKGQAWAVVGHLGHGDVQVVCHEAQDGEDYKASIHTGGTVGYADDDAVSVSSEEVLGKVDRRVTLHDRTLVSVWVTRSNYGFIGASAPKLFAGKSGTCFIPTLPPKLTDGLCSSSCGEWCI